MALRHDQGIVLRSYPFGEADRVVVLLSPNRGKLRTVAKGVRKTKSRFGGRLEPFSHVDLVLYAGRNLDTITQVSLIEPFHRLRSDLDRVVAAGTMVEVADAVSAEGESSVRLFLLLQRGLRALDEAPTTPHPDLVTAFLLKSAGVVGFAPALESCAGCGRSEDLTRFSFPSGGVLCERCRTPGAYALRDGLTDYLAGVAAADLSAMPDADPRLTGDAMGVTRRFLEYHLERRLESLAVLDA
jgi:DNA repair protein RecO (recombination protein O)